MDNALYKHIMKQLWLLDNKSLREAAKTGDPLFRAVASDMVTAKEDVTGPKADKVNRLGSEIYQDLREGLRRLYPVGSITKATIDGEECDVRILGLEDVGLDDIKVIVDGSTKELYLHNKLIKPVL